MLWNLLKSLFGGGLSKPSPVRTAAKIDALFDQAGQLYVDGHIEPALATYRNILDLDPYHVVALNQVAVCLSRLNRNGEAGPYFERAALIDDSFAPALVNYAIQLNESFHSAGAEEFLKRAQQIAPGDAHIDGVLGAVKMLRGRPQEASAVQLNAWLKSFDHPQFAHSYLFNQGFPSENTAESATAEHVFWAQTLARPPTAESPEAIEEDTNGNPYLTDRKIRIGYLSGDFRKHSVRFFFRPLLEHHDRSRFEVYGYYDMAWEDEQTRAIRERCDVFRDIANLPDSDVLRILREDRLDILVELAGHTSITRIHLFGQRLARIQMTALGYPPTTGWESIDYKVVDPRTAPPGSEHLYAERLLRLAESFWCFNPLEETPDVAAPPCATREHITFGCYGNISKISRRMLACWSRIMAQVPDSRLVLKAITFQDQEAKESIRSWLAAASIDLGRVDLVPPDPPERLFAAYAEVDVILDTNPFNGGTTSCFALWMGVPIVTLTGDALISRMGASMLHTLGLTDLIATSDDEYVAAAVQLARDRARLATLRANLRKTMLETPLGNGELYARQFEAACLDVLKDAAKQEDAPSRERPLPKLAEQEVLRRVEFVLRTGQHEAASRILDYCLNHYPDSVGARILRGGMLEQQGSLEEAYTYLTAALPAIREADERRGIQVNLLRLDLLQGRYEQVESAANNFLHEGLDALGLLHVELYRTAAHCWKKTISGREPVNIEVPFITVIVHCESLARLAEIEGNLRHVMIPDRFEIIHTLGDARLAECEKAIRAARAEIVVLMRPEVEILSPAFHIELAKVMENCDVVGAAGADRFTGTRWFDAGFPHAHGALILPAGERGGEYNLSIYGGSHRRHHDKLAILDCALLAARKETFAHILFDHELDGEHSLSELDWCHRAFLGGYRLGAAPLLGVMRHHNADQSGRNWFDCAAHFREKHGLPDTSDMATVAGASVRLPSLDRAMSLIECFYNNCG